MCGHPHKCSDRVYQIASKSGSTLSDSLSMLQSNCICRDIRVEFLMALQITFSVLWNVTPCNLVNRFVVSEEPCFFPSGWKYSVCTRQVSWSVLLTTCYWSDRMKKNEMGGACSTMESRCLQGFGAETWGKETTWKN